MSNGVSLNKGIIQDAGACLRLGFLRVRDRQSDLLEERSPSEEIRILYGIKVGEKAREQFPWGKLIQSKTFARGRSITCPAAIHFHLYFVAAPPR